MLIGPRASRPLMGLYERDPFGVAEQEVEGHQRAWVREDGLAVHGEDVPC